jgi:threonyl-tRNA synthetase
MILVLWRLTRGYRLRPWRSPYLRWRLETYWGVHADRIGFREFWSLAWRQRKPLFRYLRWAGEMNRARHREPGIDSGGERG